MKLLRVYRKEDLASVYVFDLGPDPRGRRRLVETVESVQPPIPRSEKWVLIVSTFAGCPVGCAMCDAGDVAGTALSADQILDQIRFVVADRAIPLTQARLKVQLARMGEPALNPAVLVALRRLPVEIPAPGWLPSVSTVAPYGRDPFFQALKALKDELYGGGRFQFQISLHTTDPASRARLIPIRCLDLESMARLGRHFHSPGDRKVTLNFAPSVEHPVDPDVVARHFDPERFVVKLTPMNPTARQARSGLTSRIDGARPWTAQDLVEGFRSRGFDVILSIGELEENQVGSNCGQFVTDVRDPQGAVREGYVSEAYRVEAGS